MLSLKAVIAIYITKATKAAVVPAIAAISFINAN